MRLHFLWTHTIHFGLWTVTKYIWTENLDRSWVKMFLCVLYYMWDGRISLLFCNMLFVLSLCYMLFCFFSLYVIPTGGVKLSLASFKRQINKDVTNRLLSDSWLLIFSWFSSVMAVNNLMYSGQICSLNATRRILCTDLSRRTRTLGYTYL